MGAEAQIRLTSTSTATKIHKMKPSPERPGVSLIAEVRCLGET